MKLHRNDLLWQSIHLPRRSYIVFIWLSFLSHFVTTIQKNCPAAIHTESFFSKVFTKYSDYKDNKYSVRFKLNIEWRLAEPLVGKCKQIILSETCMVWNPMQTMCNTISLFEWLRTLPCNILYKRTWKYFEYSI